jgi:hypothetical protein
MRAFPGCLVLAILGAATPSFAQSAYDYPWCALPASRDAGQACYYATYRQCMDTLSGIGGSCIRSPYYRGPEPPSDRRTHRY